MSIWCYEIMTRMEINELKKIILRGRKAGHFLSGMPEEAERKEFREWMRASERHGKLMDEIVSPEFLEKEAMERGKGEACKDWNEMRNRILSRKHAVRLRLVGICAAACLLLAGMTIYTVLRQYEKEQVVVTAEKIVPGGYKAILHKGGERLLLGANESRVIDSAINVENNTLVYKDREERTGRIQANRLEVPRGGEYNVILSDGTRVWLNSSSELVYPSEFTGDRREVKLSGEAYFEVAKKNGIPFVVKCGDMSTRVYGTSFNVNAYKGDGERKVTLTEGSVGVMFGQKEYMLKPGQQVVVAGTEVVVREVDPDLESAWRKGIFVFERESLEKIMNVLSRWYNMDVFFASEPVKKLHFSGELSRYSDVESILRRIESMTDLTFTINGKTVTVMAQ